MAAYRRRVLRNLFDDSPTPHIAHPPETHRRDFYVATDGSYYDDGTGGLGVVIESDDGGRVARLAVPDAVPDNNVAEYRALHLGLDVLAARTSPEARIGVLLDHDDLAANVNRATIANRTPDSEPPHPVRIPSTTTNHWRGILARVAGFAEVRAARIDSDENPAHPLANAPEQYEHVHADSERLRAQSGDAPAGEDVYPPPSRANRQRSELADRRTFDESASD